MSFDAEVDPKSRLWIEKSQRLSVKKKLFNILINYNSHSTPISGVGSMFNQLSWEWSVDGDGTPNIVVVSSTNKGENMYCGWSYFPQFCKLQLNNRNISFY